MFGKIFFLLAAALPAFAGSGFIVSWDPNRAEDLVTNYVLIIADGPLTNWNCLNPDPYSGGLNLIPLSTATNAPVYWTNHNVGDVTNAVFLFPGVTNAPFNYPTNAPVFQIRQGDGGVWFLVAIAVNRFGVESIFSEQVAVAFRPAPPAGFHVIQPDVGRVQVGFAPLPTAFRIDTTTNINDAANRDVWQTLFNGRIENRDVEPESFLLSIKPDEPMRFFRIEALD